MPSCLDLAYNVAIIRDPDEYSTNTLYVDGNILYAAGAVVYLLSSMRDDGWLDFLATGGACPHGLDAASPIAMPAPREAGDAGDAAEFGGGLAGASKRLAAGVLDLLSSRPSKAQNEGLYGALDAPLGESSTLLRSPRRV